MFPFRLIPTILICLLSLFFIPQAYNQCTETEVIITTTTGQYGNEMTWSLYDDNNVEVANFPSGNDYETTEITICIPDGCYSLAALDSYGDGWNGGIVEMLWNNASASFGLPAGEDYYFDFGINTTGCAPIVPGCTQANAFNYDPAATENDGSCQILEEIIAAQVIDTLVYSGPKDNRINWVIQNRSEENPNSDFTGQMDFNNLLNEHLISTFTNGDPAAQTPYAQYKNFFNIYASWWPDAPGDHSWWEFNIIQSMRDEIFLPWANEETGWVTWFSLSKYGGGGGAGVQRETRTGDGKMWGADDYQTLLHEFGHTMPGLPDEYTASGEWSNGNCWESGNTTGNTIKDDIPWRKWIEDDTPLPTPYDGNYEDKIGAFEGALTNYFGCHRPTAKGCYMGAGGFGEGYGSSLCAPCAQRVICFLYKYVNVIENPIPVSQALSVTGTQTMTFSADVIAPEPNTQKYEWFLNGKRIAEGVTNIELTFGSCDNYELKFSVTDTTDLVRYDEKFDEIYPKPYRELVWNIEQEDVTAYDLSNASMITDASCTGASDGEVQLSTAGGLAPYEIWLDGTLANNPATGLAPGNYDLKVVDANGCAVSESLQINQNDLLDLEICSTNNGTWEVAAFSENYDLNAIDLLWSTGATDPFITGLPDGDYSLTATINGCVVSENFELTSSSEELSISEQHFPSEANDDPTGAIYVEVTGGTAAYEIEWYERLAADRTDSNADNITASGTIWSDLPEMAFDNDLNTRWTDGVSGDAWLLYEFDIATTVDYYSITSSNDAPERDPEDWILEGSSDGNNWTALDTRTDQDFPQRLQRKIYLSQNTGAYTHYRLYVTSSAGGNQIHLQELEFIGTDPAAPFLHNANFDGHFSRTNLAPGDYRYEISDASAACADSDINIGVHENFTIEDLVVIQDGNCGVAIEFPNPDFEYYWLSDEEGSEILGTGTSFEPPNSGNFYVAAANNGSTGWSTNRKGFAVTMPFAPQIEDLGNGTLAIINPNTDEDYHWYDANACGTPIHIGNSFTPSATPTQYFIAAKSNIVYPDPIEPTSIAGLILQMDAADLDGDGQVDNPAPATSSILDWYFPTGNNWDPGNWFAYRSNHQNGLGIADWATIWLQRIQNTESNYQTVIMAYTENELSWESTAPFEALSELMPRHSDASQIYSDNTPVTTLNGSTFLNGQEVDPLSTSNPMDFCILGSTFTAPSSLEINYTDVHWEGKVGELIFYNNALSGEQMEGVSEHLRQKWISTAELESPRTPFQWGTVAAQEVENAVQLSLSPNPATEVVTIQSHTEESLTISVFDLQGKLIFSKSSFVSTIKIDVSEFVSGLYQVVVGNKENKVETLRFVKM
ncbi:MAG: hypothetical protein ACI956_001469 [Nonlabens sp.]|jgi:hypothetical protein